MTLLEWSIHPYAAAAGWVLLLALWQTTAIALAFAAWQYMVRRASVQRIYTGGVAGLTAMVVVVAATTVATTTGPVTSAIVVTSATVPEVAVGAAAVETPGPFAVPVNAQRRATVSRAAVPVGMLGLLWLAGSVCLLVRLAIDLLAVDALRRTATPLRDLNLIARVERLAAGRSIHQAIEVLEMPRVVVPMVAGWRRPAIIVPPGLSVRLAGDELDAVLAHEVAHVHRRDYAANLLQRLIEAALFFSPAVHWVSMRVRHAREFCCDDAAVEQSGGHPLIFARALETLAHADLMRRGGLGLAIVAPPIASRVRRLLHGEPRRSPVWSVALVAALLVTAVSGASGAAAGFDAARTAVTRARLTRQLPASTPLSPSASSGRALQVRLSAPSTEVAPPLVARPIPAAVTPVTQASLSDTAGKTEAASAPQDPVFEVASIRTNPSGRLGYKQVRISEDRLSITNTPLMQLVQMAYGVDSDLVAGGPDWQNDDGFDVEAKAERPFTSAEERNAMLRALLADRFKLVAHREQHETPSTMLTVARSDGRLAPGLRPAQTSCRQLMDTRPRDQPGHPCGFTGGESIHGEMHVKGLPLDSLVAVIRRDVNRPVVDGTGLTGYFDWDIRWTPSLVRLRSDYNRQLFSRVDPDGPALETALEEQLGLKLATTRAPVEFLVIDSVQRPTEN
jgi:uncharacterized protein (TIGR03435 family)